MRNRTPPLGWALKTHFGYVKNCITYMTTYMSWLFHNGNIELVPLRLWGSLWSFSVWEWGTGSIFLGSRCKRRHSFHLLYKLPSELHFPGCLHCTSTLSQSFLFVSGRWRAGKQMHIPSNHCLYLRTRTFKQDLGRLSLSSQSEVVMYHHSTVN